MYVFVSLYNANTNKSKKKRVYTSVTTVLREQIVFDFKGEQILQENRK